MGIIGISGKAQSGKNTVAKIWQLLDVWYNTEERTNFDGMMSDTQYVEYMLEDDKISYNKSSWQQKSFAHKIKQITCILLGCTMEQLEDPIFKETPLGEEWWVWVYYEDPTTWDRTLTIYEEIAKRNDTSGMAEQRKLTPRMLMQMLGTEFGRDMVHPNLWVNALMNEYKHSSGYSPGDYMCECDNCGKDYLGAKRSFRCEECSPYLPNWLITDCRFPDEAKAIKDKGGTLIRVNRRKEFLPNPSSSNGGIHYSEVALDNYSNWDYVIDNNGSIEDLAVKVKEIMIKEGVIQ